MLMDFALIWLVFFVEEQMALLLMHRHLLGYDVTYFWL